METESTNPEKKESDGDTKMQDGETKEPVKMVKKTKVETVYHPLRIVRDTYGLHNDLVKQFRELEEKIYW
jgi:hypothetical protein